MDWMEILYLNPLLIHFKSCFVPRFVSNGVESYEALSDEAAIQRPEAGETKQQPLLKRGDRRQNEPFVRDAVYITH